jgi:spore germination cell wall hydrolase CwlJ-like protein
MAFSIRMINSIFGVLLLAVLINAVTAFKFGSVQEVALEKPRSYVSAKNVDRTLDCLAMNIYKEAAQESFEGKVAVAQVTLNRVDDPRFPKDVCAVVYQKNIIMEKVVCQFSWYCIGKNKNKPTDEAYKESYAVAKKVLLEGFRLDSLHHALYYHAVYVNPSWPYQKINKIGNHIFYKDKA